MALGFSVRKLLAALLIGAQASIFSLIAMGPAFAAPCPVHAAVAPAQDQHASGHHGHAVPEKSPANTDDDRKPPMLFGYACCAAHIAGVFAPDIPLADTASSAAQAAGNDQSLTPGELSSADPPPRLLL
jgi:hypothetical protein